jgi:hypothetical protein
MYRLLIDLLVVVRVLVAKHMDVYQGDIFVGFEESSNSSLEVFRLDVSGPEPGLATKPIQCFEFWHVIVVVT